jgi:signal transduction protein with GAF and PtsI domain
LSAFLLLGLGYETLSVAPPALPLIRWLVRQVSMEQARAAATAALEARGADQVLAVVHAALSRVVDMRLLADHAPGCPEVPAPLA